ncbi:MAG: Unknown protein [uncultured Sulfurovum sp.]|uniref:Uncharacterized protein n=1 Tax=uncultured Sulfurovum sp. TaxID=269237 RepID=A0A6S6SHP6_9BACT|nr:MAG: Unknown protein [uncultured Sulfurovum sp.]
MSKPTFANICMYPQDINFMTSSDFNFEVFSSDGNIEYNGKLVGVYNGSKNKVSIRGKRNKDNPLVLWLADNSFFDSSTAYHIHST